MPSEEPRFDSASPAPDAESLFSEYQRLRARGESPDFEALCAAHPHRETALRILALGVDEAAAGATEAEIDPAQSFAHEIQGQLHASSEAPLIGSLIAGRFQCLREIGRGGMGVVYEVWDETVGRPLAMKVLRPRDSVGRFRREAGVTARLAHPGVVGVQEFGTDGAGSTFFTMDLVEGWSFDQICRWTREGREEWTVARSVDILRRVCDTLAYAHSRGVIHRDLKPTNVMVGSFGETYVMDWGLARVSRSEEHSSRRDPKVDTNSEASLRDPDVTLAGTVMGTPAFMPPEQAAGDVDVVDERSDVYAVGALLYTLLTGRRPYFDSESKRSSREIVGDVLRGPPESVSTIDPAAPPELVAICEKAMARQSTGRYESMEALREDLRAFLENRVVSAHRTGALAEFRKWVVRNRAVAYLSFLSLSLAALGLVAFTVWAELARREIATERDDKDRALNAEQIALGEKAAAYERAEGLRVAAQSRIQLDKDPGFALLLALEADSRAPGAVSESALHAALIRLREEKTLLGHSEVVKDGDFSADGTRVVTTSEDKTLRVWSVADGLELQRVFGHDHFINTVRFHPDDTRIVSSSWDSTVRTWDVASGAQLEVLSCGRGGVYHANYSPNGRRIVAACRDGQVRVFEADDGALVATGEGHRSFVQHASFSADSTRIVSASADRSARIWDGESGRILAVLNGHESFVQHARFGRRDELVVTASADGTARIWNAFDGQQRAVLVGHLGSVIRAEFDASGRRVLTGSADGTARVWDADTGDTLAVLAGHGSALLGSEFSPDGRSVLTASYDRTARIWDAASGSELARLGGHSALVTFARFDPSGRRALTGAWDHSARLWNADVTDARRRLTSPWKRGGVFGRPMDFSRDRRLALVRGTGLSVEVRDAASADLIVRLQGHSATIHDGRFDPTGTRVVTASLDNTARVWNLPGGESHVLRGHRGEVVYAEFDPAGERVITSSRDSDARVWDAVSGETLAVLEAPRDGCCRASVFDPTGERAAMVTDFGIACVYDLGESGARVATPRVVGRFRHSAWFHGAALSHGGTLLLAAANDDSMRVWNVTDGQPIATLRGHTGNLRVARFRSDERYLLTLHDDAGVRLWTLPDGVLRAEIESDADPFDDVRFETSSDSFVTVSTAGVETRYFLSPRNVAEERKPRRFSAEDYESIGLGTPEDRDARKLERRFDDLRGIVESARSAWATRPWKSERLQTLAHELYGALRDLPIETLPKDDEHRAIYNEAARILGRMHDLSDTAASFGVGVLNILSRLERYVWTPLTVDLALGVASADFVIPRDATWRYRFGTSEPSEGLAWTSRRFGDSSWSRAAAPFGYGFSWVETTTNEFRDTATTMYLRREFDIDELSNVEFVEVWMRCNHAFVAHLNGVEIARERIGFPGDVVPHDTLAASHLGGIPLWESYRLDPKLLRTGSNVLAVQAVSVRLGTIRILVEPALRIRRRPSSETIRRLVSRFYDENGAPADIARRYFEGRVRHRESDFAGADSVYRDLLASGATDARILCRRVETLRALHRDAEADALLRSSIDGDEFHSERPSPDSIESSWELVQRRFENLVDYRRAFLTLRDAVRAEPLDSEWLSRLGLAYCRLGLLDDAQRTIESALRRNAERCHGVPDARDLVYLAVVHLERGDLEEARSYWELARTSANARGIELEPSLYFEAQRRIGEAISSER